MPVPARALAILSLVHPARRTPSVAPWHSGRVVHPPPDEIAVRAVFAVAFGPALVGEWTWAQVRDGSSPDWVHADPPWLRNPEMSWNDRHGPIELRANVPPGMEDAARALLAGSRS